MQRVRTTALIMAAVLVFTSCRPADSALTEADREAILAHHRNFPEWVKSRNSEAISQLYEDGGVLMAPGAPAVVGKADIKAFGDAFPPVTQFSLSQDTLDGSGSLAYVRGSYSITLGTAGSPSEDGKYVEVWRKQPDGTWKLVIDIWNSNLAPVPAAPDTAAKAP